MTFSESIQHLVERKSLSRSEARSSVQALMNGQVSPAQIAAFLVALRMKGETVDELVGAAEAMREAAVTVRRDSELVVDTCGTGGDGQSSFNVSTAAAFIVAGAGIKVAKHGNRSVSSRCGSADVLDAMGIPMETDEASAEAALKEIGLTFLFAPAFHPAMKYAMPIRRELGLRTIFNLLGPLTNPARPDAQLVGVFEPSWVRPVAQAMAALGAKAGLVVHGQGFDEIVLSGETTVAEITGSEIEMQVWKPEDFGLRPQENSALVGGTAEQNARILIQMLEGQPGPQRDAACMNAAALIRAAERLRGHPINLSEAFARANESVETKQALSRFL